MRVGLIPGGAAHLAHIVIGLHARPSKQRTINDLHVLAGLRPAGIGTQVSTFEN